MSVGESTLTSGGNANHDRNATINPNQEKKKTRPYLSTGFSTGIDLALQLMGLISGVATNSRIELVKVIANQP